MNKLEISTKNANTYVYFIFKFGRKQKAFQKLLGYFKRRTFYQLRLYPEKKQT